MKKISKYCAGLVLLCVLVCLLAAQPGTARGATVDQIEPDDVIFVYEEDLDLTALRTNATEPVTALRIYVDDNPEKAELNQIPVSDDTAFSVHAIDVGVDYGTYYAWSSQGGTGPSIRIYEPEISIEAVLAAPNHADKISGLNMPTGTPIAFRITNRYVGNYYALDGGGQAHIEIVLTTPGGAELTSWNGRDLSDLRVTGSEFYTDDPGMPGAVSLDFDDEGTYTVQARWVSPQGFDDYATDSEKITFDVGNRVGVDSTLTETTTPTMPPTTVATATPTEVTATPTTETTTPTTSITDLPTTAATTEPTPIPEPAGLIPVFGGLAAALLIMRRG